MPVESMYTHAVNLRVRLRVCARARAYPTCVRMVWSVSCFCGHGLRVLSRVVRVV